MKLTIKVGAQYAQTLNEMAAKANLSVDDLAEIAVYNIIALYLQESDNPHGVDPAAGIVGHDGHSGVS